ncbi:MAG: hypothetical protein HZA15_10660 [Nitrospirae bacterium]|nr:hypothetical protein [Nitrospirota bacterium]
MDVTARTDSGAVIVVAKKEYREIGLDTEGNERLGAWQIKEIIDLTLPPQKRIDERFIVEFPENTNTAEIEVILKYYLSPSYESTVHKLTKKISFGK